jgi:leader peptidase (prepilin peptidase) / N-methyltransferase
MHWLGLSVSFIYGLMIGSFMNVCVWRLPRDESLVNPPSHCPSCNHRLGWLDLVPLLSFLIQRRKCRYCGAPITWRYFGVELVTGVLFALLYLRFVWGAMPGWFEILGVVVYALFAASLVAVFLIDLEHYIIPDQLSIFGIAIGVVYDVVGIVAGKVEMFHVSIPWLGFRIPVPHSAAGILICGGLFFAVAVISYYIFKKEGVGGGDIKLAAAIGAVLPLVPALLSFFISIVLGTLIVVVLMIMGKKGRKDYVPFGPMLVTGAMVAVFFSDKLQYLWGLYKSFAGLS